MRCFYSITRKLWESENLTFTRTNEGGFGQTFAPRITSPICEPLISVLVTHDFVALTSKSQRLSIAHSRQPNSARPRPHTASARLSLSESARNETPKSKIPQSTMQLLTSISCPVTYAASLEARNDPLRPCKPMFHCNRAFSVRFAHGFLMKLRSWVLLLARLVQLRPRWV